MMVSAQEDEDSDDNEAPEALGVARGVKRMDKGHSVQFIDSGEEWSNGNTNRIHSGGFGRH